MLAAFPLRLAFAVELPRKDETMTADDLSSRFAVALQGLAFRRWQPGQLLDFLRNTIADLLDDLDMSDLPLEVRQQIHAGIKKAYDQFLRPIDIPYIPAIAESVLEDWIWNLICKELDRRLELDHASH